MSLSSRLSSLFVQDTPNENNQRNGYQTQPDLDLDLDGARQNKRPRMMEKLTEEEIDIELKRPPYYQVRVIRSLLCRLFEADLCVVHAGRRYRWHDGRYPHALIRYGEDKTTGRSSFPTEVLVLVGFIHQDLPTRGF